MVIILKGDQSAWLWIFFSHFLLWECVSNYSCCFVMWNHGLEEQQRSWDFSKEWLWWNTMEPKLSEKEWWPWVPMAVKLPSNWIHKLSLQTRFLCFILSSVMSCLVLWAGNPEISYTSLALKSHLNFCQIDHIFFKYFLFFSPYELPMIMLFSYSLWYCKSWYFNSPPIFHLIDPWSAVTRMIFKIWSYCLPT